MSACVVFADAFARLVPRPNPLISDRIKAGGAGRWIKSRGNGQVTVPVTDKPLRLQASNAVTVKPARARIARLIRVGGQVCFPTRARITVTALLDGLGGRYINRANGLAGNAASNGDRYRVTRLNMGLK